MPINVLNRIILASSNPGDIVLDPFNGSGTTVVAAAMLNRQYVGIDQSEEYVGFARKRLESVLASSSNVTNSTSLSVNVAAAINPKRSSKVMTKTDAFGRPRVTRTYRRKAAKSA